MSFSASNRSSSQSPGRARSASAASALAESAPAPFSDSAPDASGLPQVSGLNSQVSAAAAAASSLSAFEAEIVAVFADLVVLLGMPKSMGEIYGLIFASAEPPTFVDIEQKLALSKGSVSQGLRALKALGAVRDAASEEHGAGSKDGVTDGALSAASPRAARWVATTELRQLIGTLLRERLTPYLGRQDQRMDAAEAALNTQAGVLSAKDYKALKNRLEKLQTWQSRARTVLPVLGKML